MTVRIYDYQDAGAPTLDRNFGSLINILDACLVNGFGTGPTATPAGWTKAFSASNQAAYRMGGGSQRYLRVIDEVVDGLDGEFARIFGYDTMTAVDTGTSQFPLPSNGYANGSLWWKGDDVGNRAWTVIADDAFFYLLLKPTDAADISQQHIYDNRFIYGFGDGIPFNVGDAHLTVILGGYDTDNSTFHYYNGIQNLGRNGNETNSPDLDGNCIAMRSADGSIESLNCIVAGLIAADGNVEGSPAGPTANTSLLYQSGGRIITSDANILQYGYRGKLPGIRLAAMTDWGMGQNAVRSFDDTANEYRGWTLQGNSASDTRVSVYIDITGPWR